VSLQNLVEIKMRHPAPRFSESRLRRAASFTILAAFSLTAGQAFSVHSFAAEPSSGEPRKNFAAIIEQQTKQTFSLVSLYLVENPNAADAESAYRWLFETARVQGSEENAISAADTYLQRSNENQPSRTLAQQVKCIGLARSGKLKDAMAAYDEHLKSVRIRTPNDTVDLALALSVQAQIAGDYATARDVFDKLSTAMFLNPAVRELSENRISKLDLADQPAPDISVEDLEGRKVALQDWAGKVVIVDFWATNCAPCLVEFPSLKQLYADFHAKGLEIVSISLDESRESVTEFQKQAQLPWRLAMSSSDHDATRRRFEAAKIPAMYLIDQKGRLSASSARSRLAPAGRTSTSDAHPRRKAIKHHDPRHRTRTIVLR
jgi:peroxiredoxin